MPVSFFCAFLCFWWLCSLWLSQAAAALLGQGLEIAADQIVVLGQVIFVVVLLQFFSKFRGKMPPDIPGPQTATREFRLIVFLRVVLVLRVRRLVFFVFLCVGFLGLGFLFVLWFLFLALLRRRAWLTLRRVGVGRPLFGEFDQCFQVFDHLFLKVTRFPAGVLLFDAMLGAAHALNRALERILVGVGFSSLIAKQTLEKLLVELGFWFRAGCCRVARGWLSFLTRL